MVRYMRSRNRLYLATVLFVGLAPLALAARAPARWGPAWRRPIPAGGPVSLSRALVAIAPGGQTVVVDLPGSIKRTKVSWPAGPRKAALRAAVLDADRGAAIALGEHCAGEILTVYTHTHALVRTATAGPVGVPLHPSSSAKPTGGTALAGAPVVPKKLVADAKPLPVVPAMPKVWLISKGERMSVALDRWGERHTWTVVWKARRLARDWRAPAYAAIPGTFLSAVGLWAHSAIANGAPIRLIEYRANRTLVVESTDGDDNGF